MPESVQSCFELSIHLSVKRTSRELLLKIEGLDGGGVQMSVVSYILGYLSVVS